MQENGCHDGNQTERNICHEYRHDDGQQRAVERHLNISRIVKTKTENQRQ